ncbi:MAG: hypothetical protein V1736_02080, partial [Pseudomonadota bacterium]
MQSNRAYGRWIDHGPRTIDDVFSWSIVHRLSSIRRHRSHTYLNLIRFDGGFGMPGMQLRTRL